jgi:hypothetical protein
MDMNVLVGLMIVDIAVDYENDEIWFYTPNRTFKMYHLQDCCESVTISDVVGDPADFAGQTILSAYESSNESNEGYGSQTWTFYDIRCLKGSLNIRWFGESNGYYSESVDLVEIVDGKPVW